MFVVLLALSALPFDGQYFAGHANDAAGSSYLDLLDQARRMLSAADAELQVVTGVYDEANSALVEGAQWSGNIWTQNTYGFGLASPAFLPDPLLEWLRTSYLWWFDHIGDGAQGYGGFNDVPAGMLCDNGSPSGCNYMQCGPGRHAPLVERGKRAATTASKREETLHEQKAFDTAALGHDWIIEGTLAGVLMQAEVLLATRNISGAAAFLPLFRRTSDFLETRRVQDGSPLTPGAAGLFLAGNGANLLAPGYGGQGLPAGCLGNASCGHTGFPPCCTQRGMAYLSALTVTYSAVLDRLISLEELAFPAGRACTRPNADTTAVVNCTDVYRARRAANMASLPAVMTRMAATNSSYLLQALAPDGERYGEYAPTSPCAADAPCPPASRHGYFEASPNVDAIALRVVDDETAAGIYSAMQAVPGLSPCGFTLPNFPDYDASCSSSGCLGGYGTWVSGGSWSTLEGRALLAHYRQHRFDLAAASMGRLLTPYARLFKLDNPIAHQGCGPGMYSTPGQREGGGGPSLDIDSFAIPAAFVNGLFGYAYGASTLTLYPRLPDGISLLRQKFPVRWGSARLYLTLAGEASRKGQGPQLIHSVLVNGSACVSCISDGHEAVQLTWSQALQGVPTTITVRVGRDAPPTAGPESIDGGNAEASWTRDEAARRRFDPLDIIAPCALNSTLLDWASNASAFLLRMGAVGLGERFEARQAEALLRALNVSVARCEGRRDGSIAPLPAQPKAWDKYGVKYNQSKVEDYFDDLVGRIWRGLVNAISSYARDNADPEQKQILQLFQGQSSRSAQRAAKEAAARRLDGEIAAAEQVLSQLRAKRVEL